MIDERRTGHSGIAGQKGVRRRRIAEEGCPDLLRTPIGGLGLGATVETVQFLHEVGNGRYVVGLRS